MSRMNAWTPAIYLALAALLVAAAPAAATSYQLADRNATATVVLGAAEPDTDGMLSWTIDGADQFGQQWFWYRIGDDGPERSLSSLDHMAMTLNTNWQPEHDAMVSLFSDANLRVEVAYLLRGGLDGSQVADIAEIIVIDNISGGPLDLHFFQYSNFDLGGSADDDYVKILHGNRAAQAGRGPGGGKVSETTILPAPSHYEAGLAADLLARLTDDDADDLADIAGPVGPGDLAWAFQWDRVLADGQTLIISKDKSIGHAPEPLTILALGLSVTGLGAYVRRRMA